VVLAINLIAFVALVVLPKTLEPAGRLSSEMSQLIKSKQEIDNDIFIYANKTGEITHSAAYCTCSYTAQCGALPFDLVIFLSLADTTAGAGRVMALCHQLMLRLVSFSPPPLDKLPSPTATEPANQPAHRTAPHRTVSLVPFVLAVLSCPVLLPLPLRHGAHFRSFSCGAFPSLVRQCDCLCASESFGPFSPAV